MVTSLPITPEQVHEALLSLYSPTELARSELAGLLPETQGVMDLVQRAQLLRGLLLDAIQALRPANRMGPSPSASRAYDCLKLRYVSGLSVEDVAYELSLSSRQVYRDLRWAEQRIAELLNSRYLAPASKSSAAAASQTYEALVQEAETIAHKPERVSLVETVRGALSAIALIASRHAVTLNYHEPEADVLITSTPGIVRQAVTQLLSAVVQSAAGATVQVRVTLAAGAARLSVDCDQAGRLGRPDLIEAALSVVEAQGIGCELRQDEAKLGLQLTFPVATHYKVLVLEDKPGASALYSRYLEHTELEPVQLDNPNLAVDAAVKEGVAAVLLDIMMPQTDGWTVLQALKMDPRTRKVPVVICSVVDDRELGYSLGAADYLTKPISRSDLVDSLRRAIERRAGPRAG